MQIAFGARSRLSLHNTATSGRQALTTTVSFMAVEDTTPLTSCTALALGRCAVKAERMVACILTTTSCAAQVFN